MLLPSWCGWCLTVVLFEDNLVSLFFFLRLVLAEKKNVWARKWCLKCGVSNASRLMSFVCHSTTLSYCELQFSRDLFYSAQENSFSARRKKKWPSVTKKMGMNLMMQMVFVLRRLDEYRSTSLLWNVWKWPTLWSVAGCTSLSSLARRPYHVFRSRSHGCLIFLPMIRCMKVSTFVFQESNYPIYFKSPHSSYVQRNLQSAEAPSKATACWILVELGMNLSGCTVSVLDHLWNSARP